MTTRSTAYIHGRSPAPQDTFDIYRVPEWHSPVIRQTGVDEPARFPVNPRSWCRCGACVGHRAGTKGVTLRTHRGTRRSLPFGWRCAL